MNAVREEREKRHGGGVRDAKLRGGGGTLWGGSTESHTEFVPVIFASLKTQIDPRQFHLVCKSNLPYNRK